LASGDDNERAEQAELDRWAAQFDAKLEALTARQDAFLQYLALRLTEL
jgi:hypothetical protein